MTDRELLDKTIQFNKTLREYGRWKTLHERLGAKTPPHSMLEDLSSLLSEIQIEIEKRKQREEKEQAAT